jgi:hypothetical protein
MPTRASTSILSGLIIKSRAENNSIWYTEGINNPLPCNYGRTADGQADSDMTETMPIPRSAAETYETLEERHDNLSGSNLA